MTLMTAHRILIGSAVVFFVFYGVWEFAGRSGGGAAGMTRGAASILAALVLALYFRTLWGPRPPGEGREEGKR